MGRPRLPDGVKRLRGTLRPDRARQSAPDSAPADGPAPAPAHLKGEGRACWIAVTSQYRYTPDLLDLLETACEQRSLYSKARAQVEKEGLTIENAAGVVRPHPAAQIGRDALKEYRAIMAQLGVRAGLEVEDA